MKKRLFVLVICLAAAVFIGVPLTAMRRPRGHPHRGHRFSDRPFFIGDRALQTAHERLGRHR